MITFKRKARGNECYVCFVIYETRHKMLVVYLFWNQYIFTTGLLYERVRFEVFY